MKLRTEIRIEKSPFQLDYKSSFVFIGSCFAENIGAKIQACKFNSLINPLGIAYNPFSLQRNIDAILDKQKIEVSDLDKNSELYFHFDYHGSNNRINSDEYIRDINEKILAAHSFFAQANVLFVSLGTANVFNHQAFGIVNNCHKVSNDLFSRHSLSANEVASYLTAIENKLLAFNPNLKIVFTVSPIRHIRDGLVDDRKSKSILIAALHQLLAKKRSFYFPSYEMMVDDLRDYRFYTKDLIHPNEMALDYIWRKFKNCFFSEESNGQIAQIEKTLSAINHKPFHRDSLAYQKHLEKIKEAVQKLPMVDFSEELNKLNL